VPFFLFLHTYAVHDYAPDDEALAAVAPAGSKLHASDSVALVARFGAGETELAPQLRTLYRAALWQVDQRMVRRLLDTLEALDLTETTVVALVSDHGDQWLEHGGIYHGNELWQELVRVPWIVRGPGVARGEAREEVVGHVDVAPTLLKLLGVAPAPSMRGADVLAEGFEPQPALSRVFSPDGSHVAAVTSWPWRLLRKVAPEGAPELHLFRLDLDPLEQDDRVAREPQCVAALLDWLEAKLAECEAQSAAAHAGADVRATIDEELRQQLDALGYAAK
jgi:arylsulfatase A-like enzyme